jgi:hypothetical protein
MLYYISIYHSLEKFIPYKNIKVYIKAILIIVIFLKIIYIIGFIIITIFTNKNRKSKYK